MVVGPAALLIATQGAARLRLPVAHAAWGGGIVLAPYIRGKMAAAAGTSFARNMAGETLGFFPQNLTEMIPFPYAVLGIYGVFSPGGFLRSVSPALESLIQPVMWVLSLALLAAVTLGFAKKLERGTLRRPSTETPLSIVAATQAATAALLTVGMLIYLARLHPAQSYPGPNDVWAFVDEVRYYMPLAPAVFLGVGWFDREGRSWQLPPVRSCPQA